MSIEERKTGIHQCERKGVRNKKDSLLSISRGTMKPSALHELLCQ